MDALLENKATCTLVFLFLLLVKKNVSEVKKNSKTGMPSLVLALSLTALIALLPIVLIILVIFATYRQAVFFILKIKHGSKFSGLVKGSDAIHTKDEPSSSITNILAIFEYDHNRHPQDIFDTVKQTVRNHMAVYFEKLPKFQSIYLKYMGYSYMLKESVALDDCVKKMKVVNSQQEELNKAEFMSLLNDCYNLPLPRNETIFWDIFVGTQPVEWKKSVERSGIRYYPALFRNHHCVADGVALLKLWAGVFADKDLKLVYSTEHKRGYNNDRIKAKYKLSVKNLSEEVITLCKRTLRMIELLMQGLYVLLVAPASIFVNIILRAKDRNILHGPPLIGKEILALNVEESDQHFQTVKRIKTKVAGTSFPEVLLAAFSASLKDYYQKNSSIHHPEYITVLIPLVSGSSKLQHLIPGELDIKDIHFQNSFSLVLLDLPIFIQNEDKRTPLIHRLRLLKDQTSILKNSVDYQVNYLIMSVVCAILPQPLVRLFLALFHCTASASIMPGCSKLSFGGGVLPLADCAFWVPHLKSIGVSFTAVTYDKRLQIGLGADAALIPNQNDAQNILDGVYKYLDLLEKEIEGLN